MSDDNFTTKDLGNALERNVEFIFKAGGFVTKRNCRIATYEIDVLASLGNRKIIIECKNYQNSNLTIRNIIHQWNSKNQIIKANKIIIVIAGQQIKTEDITLANSFDIEIWDENTLSELFNLSLKPEELRQKLIEKIEFKPIEIQEIYREAIAFLVVKPNLTTRVISKEIIYQKLHRYLCEFIRTELQIEGSSKDDRIRYIELFEGTKIKKVFFNLIKKERSEIEYWNELKIRLSNEEILPKELQNKYLKYMNSLSDECNQWINFFEKESNDKKIKELIYYRLFYTRIPNLENCKFSIINKNKSFIIEVISSYEEEGSYLIKIKGLSNKEVNILNWLLTSENQEEIKVIDNKSCVINYWECNGLNETADKVYRILDEFIGLDENSVFNDLSLTV